ncbi:BMP family ABC transporter substrate-binding protein [Paramaledivibacter caminithermalis]|jgi:basic membrane protein A|uniref:Nucleoside-binding protein n=1 Tax=Paramaledivibacter caminithermalis (strain DSM 15212 / CIP 107654 / DViRD3) TaxID=1121301 RepID=A0A1M6S6F2_PARC5|nr:BMP family ABC transporter substrate-binding protein [Paramaledivibacter caminithermalis]SHK40271.1 nucleoside-binding protein [Paramaledivibacter caminithermalis DSM 15212]
MFKRILTLLLTLVLTFSIFTGCGKEAAEKTASKGDNDFKVGFIYVGPIGDGGWSYSHNEGRLYLENELGVETIYRESVPEGQEVEKVMNDMIDQGAKVIFATSFGYMDYVEKVSKEHPEVKFLHCSGYKTTENMSNYFGRMYEPRYLAGIVAGLKTKSNKIGYVAAFEIPEVIRGINAFTLGVRSINPDAKVIVRWTHTWYDPAKEKEAAKSLLDEGADVIAQHQDTAGPQQAAEEAGAYSIGYNTDSFDKAPKSYMTAPIWNWGPYYVEQVKAAMEGNWKSHSYWGGMKEQIVKLAPLSENAPEKATEKVKEAEEKILNGNLNVFTGPIKNQEGKIVVEEGKILTDSEMLSMDWFVEGVEGKIEK